MSPLLSTKRFRGPDFAPDPRVTALLTVKGRPKFTVRWLAYANRQKFPFTIYLADGGTDDGALRELESGTFSSLDVLYARFTPDCDYNDFYTKLRVSCEAIESPYTVTVDNDDFFSVAGIRACADFLDRNPDFVGCQGQTVPVRLSPQGGFLFSQAVLFGGALLPFYDLAQPTACDRIDAIAKSNVHTWYAATRTGVLRNTFRFVESLAASDLFFIELVRGFGLLAAGKVKCLTVPYYFRQITTVDSANIDNKERAGLIHERMLFSSFTDDLKAIRDWLLEQPEIRNGCPEAAAKIEDALKKFVAHSIAAPFRTATRSAAWRRRIRESVRDWMADSPRGSRLLSSLLSRSGRSGEGKGSHRAERESIRVFLAEGHV